MGVQEAQEEEEEGSGWGLQESQDFRSLEAVVEILEDQHFVEEEQEYVPICRVRWYEGRQAGYCILPTPV